MEKQKLSAKAVVADIREGMDDRDLMMKYSLSAKGLESAFKKLIAAGALTDAELRARTPLAQQTVEVVWTCPKCKTAQPREFDECPQCGVIVAKFLSKKKEETTPEPAAPPERDTPPEAAPDTPIPVPPNGKHRERPPAPMVGSDGIASFLTRGKDWVTRNRKIAIAAGAVVVVVSIVVGLCGTGVLGKKHATAKARDEKLDTPLVNACRIGEVDLVRSLLAKGANPNAEIKDEKGREWSPLRSAHAENHIGVIKILLAAGADVNQVAFFTNSYLTDAVFIGRPNLLRLYLSAGAKLNAKWMGYTPLMLASTKGHYECAKILLAAGADMNARDNDGNTALMFATQKGYDEIVRLLKAHGAE